MIMLQYGLIGNCKTAALVGKNGCIEWLCYPDFDSKSVFAKILDEKKGGSFEIIPDKKCSYNQRYIPNTNILETTVTCSDYSFRIIDFFPRYKKILPNNKKGTFKINKLVRLIEPLNGVPRVKILFNPQLNYALDSTKLVDKGDFIQIKTDSENLKLSTNVSNEEVLEQEFLEIKNRKYFVLGKKNGEYNIRRCLNLFNSTKRYWEKWVQSLFIPKENKDQIIRSALVLKLLTYSETGAIIAAPTTSIPEELGVERTWDYRFCWVRDAAFCAATFKKIGRDYEAKSLMEFIIKNAMKNDFLQPLYGIRGETRLKEHLLWHLEGFKKTKPVRVGNAAYNQIQVDIYGELIDVMYLYYVYFEYENKMTKKYWRFLSYVVNQIKFNWERKDSGIWEFRDIYEHFTFSKLMCYVGVDRAIKIAQHFGKEEYINDWIELKEEIRTSILTNGYNQEVGAFTIYFGAKDFDASLLLLTYYEFLEASDPRIIGTVKNIYNNLLHNGYLVKRYSMQDDFGKSKSAFTICSFWLVSALYDIGEKEKAFSIYNKLLRNSNHLGLYSEDIDIETKKLIGNFPQGYTHISLINTSLLLSEWSTQHKKIDWSSVKRNKWL